MVIIFWIVSILLLITLYSVIGVFVHAYVRKLYHDRDHPTVYPGGADVVAGNFWLFAAIPIIVAARLEIEKNRSMRIEKEQDEILKKEGLKF